MSVENWLQHVKIEHPNIDLPLLLNASQFISHHAGSQKITYAKSILDQGLAIADILLELNCDSHTIAAGMLYPHFYHCPQKKDALVRQFDPIIHKLLLGAERIESIHAIQNIKGNYNQQKKQIDNIRKMLLAMADDIRIVLIKLAERLAILQYLKHVPKQLQKAMATQTMHIYAPLANRLGIGHLKWQLEDLAFRFTEPEIYQQISKSLNMRRQDRERFIQDMKQRLITLFQNSSLNNFSLSGRAKHIYSIHRKMQRKHVDIDEIYDTSAFRILVDDIKDCYTALSMIHANWEHIPKEFDDYIAKPKPNGYRSIHTAVIGPKNNYVEIQIRTFTMHDEAELGVAAHWKYKEEGAAKPTYEEKINLLREMLTWQQEVSSEETGQDNLFTDIFKDRIYVFTPAGDIFDLEAGSTPLDFAYHIHSEIGNRCKGAKVNGKLVPLTYQLHTGDQVQIITAKEGQPSRDWLNPNLGYLKSQHALSKVKHWFRKEHFSQNLTAGQTLWDKVSRREGLNKSDLNKVLHALHFKTATDLLAAIGAGDIGVKTVLNQLKETPKAEETTETIIRKRTTKKSKLKTDFTIEGVGNMLTQLARCCQPIPGDDIIGYVTTGRGVTIHQADCINLQKITHLRPERVVNVSWSHEAPQTYPVDLIIQATDRSGLIRDISNIIANENISVIGINSRVNKLENEAIINLTIEISHIETLSRLSNLLLQIPNINQVIRRK